MLIVNIQKSECQLDNEILVSANNVAWNIKFRGKEFAQMIIIRRSRRAIIHLFFPCFSLNMQKDSLSRTSAQFFLLFLIGRQFSHTSSHSKSENEAISYFIALRRCNIYKLLIYN